MKNTIIITGSKGYIGSCLVFFLKKKYQIIEIDKKDKNRLNLLNKNKIIAYLSKFKKIKAIVHLAGESTVNENKSYQSYYNNNVLATKNLIAIAKKFEIPKIIFASTAAVYKSKNSQITENSKILPLSKYAKTNLIAERLIRKEKKLNSIIFRFFNVSGSLLTIGENHKPETHLIPNLVHAAFNNTTFKLYSDQYRTKDGTCIRDYIHIKDLCIAINKAVNKKIKKDYILNLGSGRENTIFDIIKKLEAILSIKIKYKVFPKRKGDSARLVCSNSKVSRILNWKTRFSNIKNILNSEIIWQKKFK